MPLQNSTKQLPFYEYSQHLLRWTSTVDTGLMRLTAGNQREMLLTLSGLAGLVRHMKRLISWVQAVVVLLTHSGRATEVVSRVVRHQRIGIKHGIKADKLYVHVLLYVN